ADALRYQPWISLFGAGQAPHLVVADMGMGLLRMFDFLPLSLENYANRRFLEPSPQVPRRCQDGRQLCRVGRTCRTPDRRADCAGTEYGRQGGGRAAGAGAGAADRGIAALRRGASRAWRPLRVTAGSAEHSRITVAI